MNKILLIGCGHMGSALLSAWTYNTNYSYVIVDPNKYRKINSKFNKKVKAHKSLSEIKNLKSFDIVIFAVKPQILKNILKNFYTNKFNSKIVFVSIVAGKKITFFNKYLSSSHQLIRIMPNMPALINQGMSCLIANKNTSKKNIKKIDFLFKKVGETLWLKKESDINKVTAISGSGPGYIFLLIDAFEKAALDIGISEKDTKKLVQQTFLGSINLLHSSNYNALTLSNNIAIKGGTTEAGLKIFKQNKILHKLFKKVVKAAYKKSIDLGK